MRRFARWVLNAVAVLSLLMCGASAVLWRSSYHSGVRVQVGARRSRQLAICSRYGVVDFNLVGGWPRPSYWTVATGRGELGGFFISVNPTQPGGAVRHAGYGGLAFGHLTGALHPVATDGWILHVSFVVPAGETSLIRWVSIPWAIPTFTFAAFPLMMTVAAIYRAARRRRIRATGRCRRCAYDLTGNVSGVCPECGTAVSRVATGQTLARGHATEG